MRNLASANVDHHAMMDQTAILNATAKPIATTALEREHVVRVAWVPSPLRVKK